jgi:hypothetical protein
MFFKSIALPATVNGRFTIIQLDSLKLSVLFQINTNNGSDDLGGATIVFDFDTTAINFANSPVNNVDYVFHNFYDENYSPATITRPMRNKIWINIDLPFSYNNNGTIVAKNPAWTDVVTIYFDIIDPSGTASLAWISTSPFWGIYDADNSTLWETGQFEDLFGPLPVELFSFTGELLSNHNVLLEWKTASSLNNAGFEVQKSYKDSDEWEVIDFVKNYGDPTSLTEYSYTDYTAHRFPIVRYRLKSIDNDGSSQYSQIIEINTLPSTFELSQNYPNPFNPTTCISYQLPIASIVKLKVYDILGNEVITLVDGIKDPGTHQVDFDAKNLSTGTYFYSLQTEIFFKTKKMIVLK